MPPTVKYTLLLAGATLGAFVVALLGAYVMLPALAPETVGLSPDSSAASTPDTTRSSAEGAPRKASASQDTMMAQPAPDSAAGTSQTVQRLRDSLRVVGQLQDSLRTLREQLQAAEEKASTLRQRVASLESREAKVDELKNALLDMGQRELSGVLASVDMRILEELYKRTSGRSRTQLLRAMSPDRTAQFVNQVMGEDDAPEDTTRTDAPPEGEDGPGAPPSR